MYRPSPAAHAHVDSPTATFSPGRSCKDASAIPRSELPQVRQKRSALVGTRHAIEVHAVRRCGWRHDARRSNRLDPLEELHVVIDDGFECGGAVVVEIRSGGAKPPQAGDVELVPVVIGPGTTNKSGQQRTPRIGARATHPG